MIKETPCEDKKRYLEEKAIRIREECLNMVTRAKFGSDIAAINGIAYQNEVVLPHPEWFRALKKKLSSHGIIHDFIISNDSYGVSFNGYENIINDKLSLAKQLLKINEGENC